MFGTKGLAAGQRPPDRPATPPAVESLRFDVTWKPGRSALAALFFAACAYVMWLEILDPRGVIIDHLITLGPQGADVFFMVLLLLAVVLAAAGAFNFVRSFGERRWLSLGPHGVRGPKNNLSREEVSIAYRSITRATVRTLQRQQFVEIFGNGQAIKVAAANFRSKGDFQRFVEELRARMA